MRSIPPALQAKLSSGITTLCRCWRIERRDGVIQGFTDHDEDVILDGLGNPRRARRRSAERSRPRGRPLRRRQH